MTTFLQEAQLLDEGEISMRLHDFEQAAILSTVKCLDENACVYLFGSRVDDSKKGGDIDLLVMSDRLSNDDIALAAK